MANNAYDNSIYKKHFYNTIWSIPLVVVALFMLYSIESELSNFLLIVSVVILLFQLVYFYKKWKSDRNQKR